MDEDAFTYASLRKIERMENTSPRLQKLEGRFWERLGDHLARIRQAFHDQQEEDPTSRRTVVLADELRNTHRSAESIWSLREKKVVQAALAAARRSEGRAEPPENATPEERRLWEESVAKFQEARTHVLRMALPRPGQRPGPASTSGQATNAAPRRSEDQAEAPGTTPPQPQTHPSPTAQEAKPQHESATRGPVPAAAAEGPGEAREGDALGGPAGRGAGAEAGPGIDGRAPTDGRPRDGAGPGAGEAAAVGPASQEGQAPPQQGGGGVGGAGEQQVELRLVAALKEVPLFTGPDLVNYQLKAGEIGNVPANAAKILEAKGMVRVLPDDEGAEIAAANVN